MIVCHCQSITDHEIRAAVDWMRAADPQTLITPGKIYRALGKRADCGGCLPLFLDTMAGCDTLQVPRDPPQEAGRNLLGRGASRRGRAEQRS